MTLHLKMMAFENNDFLKDHPGLVTMAYNVYWSWHSEVQDLFATLQPTTWARTHNPLAVLKQMVDVPEAAKTPEFKKHYEKCLHDFEQYLKASKHKNIFEPHTTGNRVAYFCAEYGLHESLPIYSGGLGILAGDHCKEASDRDLPFVAVGLFYRQGFFQQRVNSRGQQEHCYFKLSQEDLPLQSIVDQKGQPLVVGIPFPGRTVFAQVWYLAVGRTPLLLLDTDIEKNRWEDRPISHLLYVSGREMRVCQEIVLGVGGIRALQALNITPYRWHLNEGHSAFLQIERFVQRAHAHPKDSLEDLQKHLVSAGVFTIHTPVPAGNERFDVSLVRPYIDALVSSASSLQSEDFLDLARGADGDPGVFDMTAFCLRTCAGRNAVSKLHSETANGTWSSVLGSSKSILAVTNGVHMPTWVGPECYAVGHKDNPTPDHMGDQDIWQAHNVQKNRMIDYLKKRLLSQLSRRGDSPKSLALHMAKLNPKALIIGFARRFATYKRAALIFSDAPRLANLLSIPGCPVQLIFAGKAHPADDMGQSLIADVFHKAQSDVFHDNVFFLEDYDMALGRALTQGCDVWLNNPIRPLEASGTSGMKASANGIPNLSILDGWWDEGYNGKNGWAIGSRESQANEKLQDQKDQESLYALLEKELIPCFFNDRDAHGVPKKWVKIMKEALITGRDHFSTTRMLKDYISDLYHV